jgi:hypothetical protein
VSPKVAIEDTFPDENLFHIEGEESLYYDIVQYLLYGTFPNKCNHEQMTVFLHRAEPYTYFGKRGLV